MIKYAYYDKEELDSCDICDAQMGYLFDLALVGACNQIGK